MAQNIKPAAAKTEAPAVPKKSSKKTMIIIGVVLLLIIGAGGGWYVMKGKDGASHPEEVKEVPPKPPIFVALEPFTVNLQREASDQYLQLGLTLKVFDADIEAKIKANLPEIRSKILQLLTTKTATELLTAEGKKLLVKDIIALSNPVIGVVDLPAKKAVHVKVSAELTAPDNQAQEAVVAPVSETTPEAQTEKPADDATAIDAASAPSPAVKKPVEKKGIVDVLFTSFIIQ